ncbi:twin-arginine translocase TatA/TatE family subunit [uncultured Demequina sp.]|uniref:twin-arginine translocase TatA/TatE family subunit n=1 Tax=uncultured Demequina sp. TaxID=693499 RepID=UPI0025E13D90|nr:twin-arginine translocase TatA/TatE family subunit [uncultured Demequina sp.]
MFGINGWEFLVIVLVAILVVGPERMPEYARQLREWIRSARDLVTRNTDQLKTELGADDVDWKQYDPRQYDPRRIVREALYEPAAPAPAAEPPRPSEPGRPAPFDADAT